LDIDYMEGFRCFTWNKEYFPDQKNGSQLANGLKPLLSLIQG
jgi:alpha-glucosidase